MKLSAKVDPGDLRRLTSKIDGIEQVARSYATANALTKAGRDLRNDAIDRTKKEFPALRASRIRRDITLARATPKRLEARVDLERKVTNIIEFGARQVRRGVTAAFRGGRRAVFPGAFIARGRGSGKTLVFVRRGRGRLPIVGIPGPSVGGILRKHVDALLAAASRDIRADIAERVARILGR